MERKTPLKDQRDKSKKNGRPLDSVYAGHNTVLQETKNEFHQENYDSANLWVGHLKARSDRIPLQDLVTKTLIS